MMNIFIIVIVSILSGVGVCKLICGNHLNLDKKFVFCDKEKKWKVIDRR